MTGTELISVVIPTRGRPDLLGRSVGSALGQSGVDVEVIVVMDGPDPDTVATLTALEEPRLRWVENETPRGGSAARNQGVGLAGGDYIAFLDDDDEWRPTKLERQVALLKATPGPAIASCQIVTRTPRSEWIGPRRPPRDREPLSEYLFRARMPWSRGARLQTSALLVPRDVALALPWDESLTRFQDFDWMLRAAAAGNRFVVVPEPLSIWYFRETRSTIGGSHAADWRQALTWIDDRYALVTRRAYGRWVLARVAGLAAAAGDRSVLRDLWRRAWARGRPGAIDVAQFAWYVLRATRARRSPAATTAATGSSIGRDEQDE